MKVSLIFFILINYLHGQIKLTSICKHFFFNANFESNQLGFRSSPCRRMSRGPGCAGSSLSSSGCASYPSGTSGSHAHLQFL